MEDALEEGAVGGGRDWLAFDRADRWGFAVLIGLGLVVMAVVRVVAPILDWVDDDRLSVPFSSKVEVPGLAAVGLGHSDADYSLLLAEPTTRQRLLDLLPGVLYVVLAVVVAYHLLRLLHAIGRGRPFVRGSVRRLRVLALVLMVGFTVLAFAEATCTFAILSDVDLEAAGVDGGPRAVLELPVVPFVLGLVAAMVAEAFKTGSRLQDDVDGLV